MRKVKNSRPAGEKGKIMRKEPGKYDGEKERRMEEGEEESNYYSK